MREFERMLGLRVENWVDSSKFGLIPVNKVLLARCGIVNVFLNASGQAVMRVLCEADYLIAEASIKVPPRDTQSDHNDDVIC